MAASLRPTLAPDSPPHPVDQIARNMRWVGGFYIGLAGLTAWMFESPSMLLGVAFGGWLFFAAGRANAIGRAVRAQHSALDRIGRGRLDEAVAILDAIPARARRGAVATGSEVQRSVIALRKDDLAGAIAHATRAMEVKLTLAGIHRQKMQRAAAQGLRAVARAASGDAEGAMSDARAARLSPSASTEALASAAVAEAIVYARADDREKLTSLLTRERKTLLELTTPRDRALVRTLQRMISVRPTSVYREPAKRDEHVEGNTEEPAVATWIARVVPSAAAFAPTYDARSATTSRLGVDGRIPVAAAAAVNDARRAAKKKAPNPLGRALLLWGLLIVMFLAIWQFLAPTESALDARVPAARVPDVVEGTASWWSLSLPALVGGLGMLVFVAFGALRARLEANRFFAASRLLADSDPTLAEDAFRKLSKSRAPLYAAQADCHLATLANARHDWQAAMIHAERGIGRVAKGAAVIAAAHDHLLPTLVTERAFALAARSRHDEASAELARLGEDNPTYALLASAQLRVRMMQAVRRDDLTLAREIAKHRTPDLPLSARDELLADVLTVTSGERVVDGEVERIHAELRADGDLRAWLENVLPDAEAMLAAAASRARNA